MINYKDNNRLVWLPFLLHFPLLEGQGRQDRVLLQVVLVDILAFAYPWVDDFIT